MLIGCGDVPYYYLDFLVSALDIPLFYVRGNHDGGRQYRSDGTVWRGVQGGFNLHGRVVRDDDIWLAGLEGSMRYKRDSTAMYTEAEMTREVMRLLPRMALNRLRFGRGCDILVTHSPPRGIHDRDDLTHTGFKIFLWLMRVFRPRYLLHGHIHRYRQDEPNVTRYDETLVVNVYPKLLLDYPPSV